MGAHPLNAHILQKSEVATMLGVCPATVQYMTRTKKLHPRKVRGVWLYDLGEVEALKKSRLGQTKRGRRSFMERMSAS